MKPALSRHTGCDLVDIYPGAGLWSRKLHDALQPRSHILMEPDEELYTPFLRPLLLKPNTTLIPKTGIIWKDLNEVLCKAHLPHQVERPRHETPQRNDTLLVTANLAFYPKKRFRGFDSISDLVLYQFISSIRTSSLFQKYGLVRMLIWTGDDEKNALVPRSVQQRKRPAIDAELSTEWVNEIAGTDGDDKPWFVRDRTIDSQSARDTLARMQKHGVSIPAGRESRLAGQVRLEKKGNAVAPGDRAAIFERPYIAELEALEEEFSNKKFTSRSAKYARLKALRSYASWNAKRGANILDILNEREAIEAMGRPDSDAGRKEKEEREAAWNTRVHELNNDLQHQLLLARDNLHLFRQDRPVLNWDRRDREPLVVKNTEFFPNAACCLLDIQPKAMHPLFRAMGPRSARSGDVFELVLRSLLQSPKSPLSRALESVWPGAAEGVLPNCPSLREVGRRGGSGVGGEYAEVSPRTLNEQQLVEILDAWMKWPFAPSFAELVGKMTEELEEGAGDEEGNAVGGSELV